MVYKISASKMSFAEFKKSAKFYYPYMNKVYVQNGKVLAKYSGKTKRVTSML